MLKYGHADVLRAIDGVSNADAEKVGATPEWSIKDVMSHLAIFEHFLAEGLKTVTSPDATGIHLTGLSKGETRDAFNDEQIKLRRAKTFTEICDEFKAAHEEAAQIASEIDPALFAKTGTLPWYGEGYSIDDFVVYVNYGHIQGHTEQINLFKDKIHQEKS